MLRDPTPDEQRMCATAATSPDRHPETGYDAVLEDRIVETTCPASAVNELDTTKRHIVRRAVIELAPLKARVLDRVALQPPGDRVVGDALHLVCRPAAGT